MSRSESSFEARTGNTRPSHSRVNERHNVANYDMPTRQSRPTRSQSKQSSNIARAVLTHNELMNLAAVSVNESAMVVSLPKEIGMVL